jgi:hypothetical protein
MRKYVVIWSDNILDLTDKVNKFILDKSTKLVGGLTISQTNSSIKYYQAITIEEVIIDTKIYTASAIKSPTSSKESFDIV